jgi:hypothetical protein
MYRTREAARSTARAAIERDRGFGEFVTEVRMGPGLGISYSEWGPPGHLTVWGESLILMRLAADTLSVAPEQEPEDAVHDPG